METRHQLFLVALFSASCAWGSSSRSLPPPTLPPDGTELGQRFRSFAELKKQEVRDTARRMDVALPAVVPTFFSAVGSNQWSRAERSFVSFRDSARRQSRNDDVVLAVGMQDVSGVYDLMADWSPPLVDVYCREALRAIPDGAVVFGGTDEGRFLITYGAETFRTGLVTVVTQNALADNTYADYVRTTTSNKLSMFTLADSAAAFQEYVKDVKAGRRDPKGSMSIEDGRVKITGVYAVMEINGILAKKLFNLNKASHPFYVEESYIIDWMYDYLLPHGLVMKLNEQPVEEIPKDVVASDQKYWKSLESKLNTMPDFSESVVPRKAFSKCRCAIAGLYSHHGMNREAESAFRQALRLYPASPEGNFRLADHLKRNGQYVEAGTVMTEYMKTNPSPEQMPRITEHIRELRQLRDGEQDESTIPVKAAPSASSTVR